MKVLSQGAKCWHQKGINSCRQTNIHPWQIWRRKLRVKLKTNSRFSVSLVRLDSKKHQGRLCKKMCAVPNERHQVRPLTCWLSTVPINGESTCGQVAKRPKGKPIKHETAEDAEMKSVPLSRLTRTDPMSSQVVKRECKVSKSQERKAAACRWLTIDKGRLLSSSFISCPYN